MLRRFTKAVSFVVVVSAVAACAGHPVQIGLYTPYPEDQILKAVHARVLELGYSVQRMDTTKHELLAFRTLDPPVKGADREEMLIQIAPDVTGSTKLTITSSRIMPATATRPMKRVAASAKTNADANNVLNLYMKVRRN